MASIAIITGSPGAGKTTFAAYLSNAKPRGVHIPSDVFYTFPAHPISPYRSAAQEQNTDIIVAITRTAATFATRGYDVFLDGIFGPWFLPVIAAELQTLNLPVDYVVLRAPLEVALRRVQDRIGHEKNHAVREMHAQFANLGPYDVHVLDSAEASVEKLAVVFESRRADGHFRLNIPAVLSKGAA